MFNEDAVAARREATAMTLLPKMFDSVRAVFGSSGPTVMSTQKVRLLNLTRPATTNDELSQSKTLELTGSRFNLAKEFLSFWSAIWSRAAEHCCSVGHQ